ncbi:hypothetical protein IFR05_014156 [Cadophora sp. M221]|nr:hypothetical protein IFR05_014156 [Cadophora sp. M221]
MSDPMQIIYKTPIREFNSRKNICWKPSQNEIFSNFLASLKPPHDEEIPTTAYKLTPFIEELGLAHHKDARNSEGKNILDILVVKISRKLKSIKRLQGGVVKREDQNATPSYLPPLPISRKRAQLYS